MKINNAVFFLFLVFIYGCGGSGNGELIGVQDRPIWNPTDPYGMVFVPQGSFNMGPGYQDVPYANARKSKTISVAAFYMDETEITNNEYRQFVYWVRDSIAHVILGNNPPEDAPLMTKKESDNPGQPKGITNYKSQGGYMYLYEDKYGSVDHMELDKGFKVKGEHVPNKDAEYFPDHGSKSRNSHYAGEGTSVKARVNWDKEIDYDNPWVMDRLIKGGLFSSEGTGRYYGRRTLNTRALRFGFEDVDVRSGAKKENRDWQNPNPYIIEHSHQDLSNASHADIKQSVAIYPDTLVWIHDYAYSYNEPWTRNYFHHPAFDEYPVVGVNWHQAKAFSQWRTMILDNFLISRDEPLHDEFRLPTESEWEYASRGGLENSPYPWGGPYTVNEQGCYLANFKPLRGNYTIDGGIRTVEVASYNPNDFGLYDMSGNVAEWTSNTYDESSYAFTHDMNTDMDYLYEKDSDSHVKKRKVIRGGSWKDISYYIQNGTRTYEYQDTAKSYIGFRNVISFLGRDKVDLR